MKFISLFIWFAVYLRSESFSFCNLSTLLALPLNSPPLGLWCVFLVILRGVASILRIATMKNWPFSTRTITWWSRRAQSVSARLHNECARVVCVCFLNSLSLFCGLVMFVDKIRALYSTGCETKESRYKLFKLYLACSPLVRCRFMGLAKAFF